MKQTGGVWLPDHEQHLIDWMLHPKNKVMINGRLAYQWKKQQAAMSFVKKFRTAVDVGAHCGLWSMHLAERFQAVHAFEPVAEHRECFEKNLEGAKVKPLLYALALGDEIKTVSIHTSNKSSGDSWVDGEGNIPMRRLDEYDLQDVDFIKLDCEGYELFALRGGEETLIRCRPCVIVEQKPGRAEKYQLKQAEAVDYLRGLGAVLRREISGDFIMTWDD